MLNRCLSRVSLRTLLAQCLNSVLNVKVLVGPFNQGPSPWLWNLRKGVWSSRPPSSPGNGCVSAGVVGRSWWVGAAGCCRLWRDCFSAGGWWLEIWTLSVHCSRAGPCSPTVAHREDTTWINRETRLHYCFLCSIRLPWVPFGGWKV